MESLDQPVTPEFRKHWPILVGTTCAVASGASLFVYSSSYFVKPLEAYFGWSRGEIAFGATLAAMVNAIGMPIMGMLTDRFGPRTVGATGLVCYGLLCFLLASITPGLLGFYAMLVLISASYSATTAVVIAPLVASTFQRRRGLALGIMMSGPAMLLVPFAPLLASLLEVGSWRAGYAALGCIALFLGLPGLVFAQRNMQVRAQTRQAAAATDGLTLPEALRTASYWKLMGATVLATLPLGGVVHQYAALLSDKGLSAADVGLMGSLFVVSVVIGRTGVGYLLDNFRPPLVAMAVLLCAAGAALLMLDPAPSLLFCAIFLLMSGCAMGAEGDFHAFFTARQFGMANFSTIFGTFAMCTSGCFGLGALMFGAVHDRFGNYDMAIMLAAGMLTLSAFLIGSIPASAQARGRSGTMGAAGPQVEHAVQDAG